MRTTVSSVVLWYALLLAGPSVLPSVAGPPDVCKVTTSAAIRACEMSARSAGNIRAGKCATLSGAAAQKLCNGNAAADTKDALATCNDQRAVRKTACARLGSQAYDPVIDPANFVAAIDNPFFPLVPGTTFVYEGHTPDGLEHDEFAVPHKTRVIRRATRTGVHDRLTPNAVL